MILFIIFYINKESLKKKLNISNNNNSHLVLHSLKEARLFGFQRDVCLFKRKTTQLSSKNRGT